MKHLLKFLRAALLLLAGSFAALAMAQGYPNRPVKLIVPYPPGGPVDNLARGVADQLSKNWGQPVLVDNRAGGNEIVAVDVVKQAAPDGYTLLLGADPAFVSNQFLFKKLSYNPLTDLVPISRVAYVNMALIVDGRLPVNNLKEFVALVKANPGKYNYGTAGSGTAVHIHFDAFLRETNLNMSHIPYKGIGVVQGLLGGDVQATMLGITAATPYLESGKIKILAIGGDKRAKSLPNVPTFAEAGFPKVESYFFMGLAAPKGTPKAIVDTISNATRKAMAYKSFVDKYYEPFAFNPLAESPEEFSAYLVKERVRAAKKIKDAGASLDN
jgi:tripartite-type tricarboxylate transporter receptor subunit TctC